MNAIVSICHFCELHGPSVVFCTQAFRDLLGFNDLVDIGNADVINVMNQHTEEQAKDGDTNLWKYGRLQKDNPTQAETGTPSNTCVACRSFLHSQPGYISNDDQARVSYVSSQYPLQPELYILVRQACIRSLSCEVCPEREGPIYFGDEARGHVLSYTFFLRDVQARGFQRWYSIMVLMKDKMLLLNSWPFIVKHLKQIINHLQDSASKIYESEESKVSHRALRSAAVMMDNFRKQRVAGQPRPLCEMVGEEKVWQHLHSSFTWLLKAGGLRLQERLVEGPPITTCVADHSSECEGLSVHQLYNILGSTIFHHMMHHLLIGRQVILRGTSDMIISSLVKSIKPLLPKHCYKAIHFSPHYVDCVSCNVLGLHSLVKVPPNILTTGNLCVIDLVPKDSTNNPSSKASTESKLKSSSNLYEPSLNRQETEGQHDQNKIKEVIESTKNYTIKITREGSLPARPPQILSRIESAVSNSSLSHSTLTVYLSTIIYEWINKVKVWIHVQNTKKVNSCPEKGSLPSTSLHPGIRSPSIPILRSPSHSLSLSHSPAASSLRSISPGGPGDKQQETTPQDERHQLLAAIGSTEWDVPLLEFWAKYFT